MASLIITSIGSLLDDLELLRKRACLWFDMGFTIPVPIPWLRNLKIFRVCERKLSKDEQLRSHDNCNEDGSIGSLLLRIEQIVCINALKIYPCCLSLEDGFLLHVMGKINYLQNDVEYFEKEIDEWYITLLGYSGQSSSLMVDEVMEIINSVKNNLVDSLSWGCFHGNGLQELIESLAKKLSFLENFIRCSALPTLGHLQLEALLLHIEALAINAAHLSYPCRLKMNVKEVSSEISVLLQKIKFIDPEFYKSYAEALTISKLLRQLHTPIVFLDGAPIIMMKDFIYSLAFDIEEMLQVDTCHVICIKGQVHKLYVELRFLRRILLEQANKGGEIVQMQNEEELQPLWNGVFVEAYKVGFLVDHMLCGDILYPFFTSFDTLMKNIRNIKTDPMEIFYGKRQEVREKQLILISNHVLSENIDPITDEVVGFDDDPTSIIVRLARETQQLWVVVIVGISGLGKTTLITQVYNDPLIMHQFYVCAWCSVSQVFDKKEVLLELLNHIFL